MAYKDKLKEFAVILYNEAGAFQNLLTSIVLAAGSNIIGKVGIDQTTPGTTNAIDAKTIGGQAPQLDSVNRLGVSLYGAKSAAGDTAATVKRINSDGWGDAVDGLLVCAASHVWQTDAGWARQRSIAISGEGLGVARVGTLGELITLAASAARTTGANGTPVTGLGWRKKYFILLDVTAAGTLVGDTLDAYIDVSLDGTTWLNAVHFTQVLGNGGAKQFFAMLDGGTPAATDIAVSSDAAVGVVRPTMAGAPQMRPRWAIADGGGTHSFTFSITAWAI